MSQSANRVASTLNVDAAKAAGEFQVETQNGGRRADYSDSE